MEGFHPLFFNLQNRKCLVVGGGRVALRKVNTLLSCRADIFIISSYLFPQLASLKENNKIMHLDESYDKRHLQGIFLAISATDDAQLNRRVAEDCFEQGIPVNTADDPSLCSFFFPAVFDRGSLKVAISTSGKSPAFARQLKEELENNVGNDIGDFVDFLGSIRPKILEEIKSPSLRKEIFNELAAYNYLEIFRNRGAEELNNRVEQILSRFKEENP